MRSHKSITLENRCDLRVLVVDDEPAMLETLQEMLLTADHQSDAANSVASATDKINAQLFDLVITDMMLPDGTGQDVAVSARQSNENTLVIFITGHNEYGIISKIAQAQPFGFLRKPFSLKQLLKLIDAASAKVKADHGQTSRIVLLEKLVQEHDQELRFKGERLIAEKELLHGLISGANFGLIAIDTFQHIHLLNDLALVLLGGDNASADTYHGKMITELFSPEVTSITTHLYERICEGTTLEKTTFSDKQNNRILHIIAYPFHHRQQVSGVVFIIHDISERELLQKRLIHASKLASLGELAAGVAHEINNPLGFVMSNCNTLSRYFGTLCRYLKNLEGQHGDKNVDLSHHNSLEQLREELDLDYILEDVPNILLETSDGLERVSKIVKDLKAYARVEMETPERHQLNQLIDDALNMVRNTIKYVLEVKKDYSDLPSILCYPGELVQVFTNFFVNAAHAVEKKGHGTLSIQTQSLDDVVVVRVCDDGDGIPESILSKIFDPFFTTKEPGKGTGMGLSISYSIIQRHAGEITVKSALGKGTEFTIELPVDSSTLGFSDGETIEHTDGGSFSEEIQDTARR